MSHKLLNEFQHVVPLCFPLQLILMMLTLVIPQLFTNDQCLFHGGFKTVYWMTIKLQYRHICFRMNIGDSITFQLVSSSGYIFYLSSVQVSAYLHQPLWQRCQIGCWLIQLVNSSAIDIKRVVLLYNVLPSTLIFHNITVIISLLHYNSPGINHTIGIRFQ